MKRYLVIALGLGFFLAAVSIGVDLLGGRASGRPHGTILIEEDGQYFLIPRGGGPVEARVRTSITVEQARLSLKYHRVSAVLLDVGVGIAMLAGSIMIGYTLRRR